jgi:hypothetical protein
VEDDPQGPAEGGLEPRRMMNLRAGGAVVRNAQLAGILCLDSVELSASHARHVALHGNLIPHAFMGEVLARARACVVAGAAEPGRARAELERILATLESAMAGGDRETCSVIGISFVADGCHEPFFSVLEPMLGPRLAALIRG